MAELEKFIETDADDGTVKLNGKNTFKKNQYVTEGNYAVDLANSDIWEANGIWFADTSNAINKGFMFPRSDGKWDSLSVLDGKIKLTTGVTTGLGVPITGGNTQVIADCVVETKTSGLWDYTRWNSGRVEMTYAGEATFTSGYSIRPLPTGWKLALVSDSIESPRVFVTERYLGTNRNTDGVFTAGGFGYDSTNDCYNVTVYGRRAGAAIATTIYIDILIKGWHSE